MHSMTTTADYQASSRAMMAQSRDELAQGDLQQASEKGWGTTTQMMKTLAKSRSWEHGRHRHLHQIASRLPGTILLYGSYGGASGIKPEP